MRAASRAAGGSYLKIAVFHNLPSGGAKRALCNAVRYLVRTGHQVDVHVPSTANERYLPLKDIATVYHIYPQCRGRARVLFSAVQKVLGPFQLLADAEHVQRCIAEAINAGPYDVVLSEQDQLTSSPFILKYLKKPTAYYCQQPLRTTEAVLNHLSRAVPSPHIPAYQKVWRTCTINKPIERADAANAACAKYLLANSYFSREAILRAYGVNAHVCYLGIDTDVFRPLQLPRDEFVLSTGSCGPLKGFDFIIRSLGRVERRVRPGFAIVANSVWPEWREYLVRLAARLEVNLEVKVDIGDMELLDLYNRARLFVYAPVLEPFGLAPLEAMSCATPVVAVKEGGPRETVIHQETGILTDRDEQAFAEAITGLLRDENLCNQLGGRAAEVIRRYWTFEQAGERLVGHLTRAQKAD